MANLVQLSAIEGAVTGYEQGRMNEQELQKWLVNFKEQQRQFNVGAGMDKEELGMRKEEHKRLIRDLDLSYKSRKTAYDIGEDLKLSEKEKGALAEEFDQRQQQAALLNILSRYSLEAAQKPGFKTEYEAGELARARLGNLGVRGLTAEVRGKEIATGVAEQTQQDVITQSNIAAQTAQAQFDALMQTVDGTTLFEQGALNAINKDFAIIRQMLSQGDLMDANTTARTLQTNFTKLMQEGGRTSEAFRARKAETDLIEQQIQGLVDRTAQGWRGLELEEKQITAEMMNQALRLGGTQGYSEPMIRAAMSHANDTIKQMDSSIRWYAEKVDLDEEFTISGLQQQLYNQQYLAEAHLNTVGLTGDWAEVPSYMEKHPYRRPALLNVRQVTESDRQRREAFLRTYPRAVAGGDGQPGGGRRTAPTTKAGIVAEAKRLLSSGQRARAEAMVEGYNRSNPGNEITQNELQR